MKPTEGKFFRREDYAPLWLRVIIAVIDGIICGCIFVVLAIPIWLFVPSAKVALNTSFIALVLECFGYLVLLKRSRFRTLGYRVGKVRIVGTDGQPASISSMVLRLTLAPVGPLSWFLDLIWLSNDSHRQSISDKLAHTYVVRVKAEPVGAGRLIWRGYEIFGFNFMFQEIEDCPPVPTA